MPETSDEVIRTFESGPSDPVRFTDEPGTAVEVVIDAPVSTVWALASDIGVPARFSEELIGADWNEDGPGPNATFTGRNKHAAIGEWTTQNFVTAFEIDRSFAWSVVDRDNPGARWRFDLGPASADDGEATTLRFSVVLGPGPSGTTMAIESMPDKEAKIIHRRIGEINANMSRTVHGIRSMATSGESG